jgi:hypothetical protein
MTDTDGLAQAARKRHAAALQRATDALRRLDRAGAEISFVTVARQAGVSRSWLYRQPELRAQVERLRAKTQPHQRRQVPAAQQASAESLQHRIDALREQAARLTRENHDLRDQLARKLGADRLAALGGRQLQ